MLCSPVLHDTKATKPTKIIKLLIAEKLRITGLKVRRVKCSIALLTFFYKMVFKIILHLYLQQLSIQ